MIDTHAHLDFPEFDEDREEVISRFFEQEGKAIINVGVDLERSKKSVEIAGAHDGIFASVGLHPDHFNESSVTKEDTSRLMAELGKLGASKKVVAVGETGLDYFSHTDEPINPAQKEKQKAGFIAQINLAKELGLPIIVHCREAWDDLYQTISGAESSLKFVLHCYSGEKKDTEKFLNLQNVFFSFSGNITYPKPVGRAEGLAEAVRIIPLDRMMLDSDSPFLSPQKYRGKRNEPAHVQYIAEKIADIKEISADEVVAVTDENAENFFHI